MSCVERVCVRVDWRLTILLDVECETARYLGTFTALESEQRNLPMVGQ